LPFILTACLKRLYNFIQRSTKYDWDKREIKNSFGYENSSFSFVFVGEILSYAGNYQNHFIQLRDKEEWQIDGWQKRFGILTILSFS
jgi:hypothetical protein